MKNIKIILTIKTVVVAIVFSFAIVFPTTTIIAASAQIDRTYQSEEGGYRLQIPEGWVIEDLTTLTITNGTTTTTEGNTTRELGVEYLAKMCKENEALPGIGGTHKCEVAETTAKIVINGFPNLQSRPEFVALAREQNKTITVSDLVALHIEWLDRAGGLQIKIENTTDIDNSTKIIEMAYKVTDPGTNIFPFDDVVEDYRMSGMFVLSEDRNTGYSVTNPRFYNETQQSPAVQEVFSSFEVVEDE
jgi:hypothetical protein